LERAQSAESKHLRPAFCKRRCFFEGRPPYLFINSASCCAKDTEACKREEEKWIREKIIEILGGTRSVVLLKVAYSM
jgi:hypothetical protein